MRVRALLDLRIHGHLPAAVEPRPGRDQWL